MDPLTTLILFIVFIFLSAFFSWTELALMSLSSHKIESLVKQKKSWALTLKKIKENNERLLITILIWNNLVNVAASVIAASASVWIANSLWLWEWLWMFIATWTVTIILLLFWEITPKTLAIKYSEWISLAVAPFYRILTFLLLPIVIFAELFLKLVSKITWVKTDEWENVTADDVDAFIEMSNEMWVVEDEEHSQIRWILNMNDTEVRTIMTPRINIVWINWDLNIKSAIKIFFENSHSRLPVYLESLDNIIWIITFREIIELNELWKWDILLKTCKLLKPVTVPSNQHINSVFNIFKKSHKHMAIVMDEYGGVDWLVTLEDIMEEVFWEIQDETDNEENKINKISNTLISTNWNIAFKDILDVFHIWVYDIEDSRAEEYLDENLNYIINDILDRFAKPWDNITFWKVLEFNIKEVSDKVINTVEVRLIKNNN